MQADRPWLKTQEKAAVAGLRPEKKPLYELLRDSAREFPDRPSLSYNGRTMSYAEVAELSARFASALASLGVRKGDRVALFMPNIPQFVISYFGILEAGGVVVACNPLYKERELEHQLRDSGAEVVVATKDVVRGTDLYSSLQSCRGRLPLRHVVAASVTDYLPPLKRRLAGLAGVRTVRRKDTLEFLRLIGSSPPTQSPVPVEPSEDLAVLQYTGGTTGVSKGAMLTHWNVYSMTIRGTSFLPLGPSDVFLAVLPLFHVYGGIANLTIPFSVGAEIVLLPTFHVEEVLGTVQRMKATIFCGVPAMFMAINSNPKSKGYDLSSLRLCVSGGSALPAATRKAFMQLTGGKLVEGYGLSETSALTHCNPVVAGVVKDGSVGIPFPETDAVIVDLDDPGKLLPPGGVGELAVKGPQVMKGYWNQKEETEMAFHDGWFLTGDIAKMDDEGYFYIVDRKKDMINVAGMKVYPREVEEVLYEHPAIREAAAVAAPDSFRGEVVKAFVVKKDPAARLTVQEVTGFCAERLVNFKVPKQVEFVPDLPKSVIGKVLRRKLREASARQS
ncbi:MAG TPA: long-chain fatty acid--CoA ligase [Nitrososphaerales archaeon]|nr:long-chain fatty acid--CoA ligase [Nitrososphaerales archaeon]